MKKTLAALFVLLSALPSVAAEDVLELYDVRDIAKGENRTAEDIGKIVSKNIEAISELTVKAGVLVVKAPPEVQEKVRQFLADFRRGLRDVLRVFPVEDLLDRGHRADDLAGRVRKLSPDAKVMVHEGRRLFVAAPPAVQALVEGTLTELRRESAVLVTIEARLLRGGERGAEGDVRYLDEAELTAFLGETKKAPDVTVLTAAALTCWNGQRASLAKGTERTYVKDLEVTLTEDGGLIAEPVVEKMFEGVELTLRPILSVDRKFVTLLSDVRIRKLLETRLAEPKPGMVRIELPEVRETRRLTTVTLPVGHAALLDLGEAPGEKAKGRLRLLLRASGTVLDEEGK